jgi:hypothetical protein
MKKILLTFLTVVCLAGSARAADIYFWRYRTHATDCTSLTDGKPTDMCYEQSTHRIYKCTVVSGASVPADWKLVTTADLGDFVARSMSISGGNERVTGNTYGEYMDFKTLGNGYILFSGTGGTTNANISFHLDGTNPTISTTSAGLTFGVPVTVPSLVISGTSNFLTTGTAAAGQYFSQEYDNGNATGTKTIDWDNGNTQYVTLTGDTTFTFSNPSTGGGGRYVLHVAGGYSPTFPGTVRWPGGPAPTPTALAGYKDVYTFIYSTKESLYDGSVAQQIATS